jgi:hypothetical protein
VRLIFDRLFGTYRPERDALLGRDGLMEPVHTLGFDHIDAVVTPVCYAAASGATSYTSRHA